MLMTLLDFFCSRPFPDPPSAGRRLVAAGCALFWALAAFVLGLCLAGDFAVPGENAVALAAFTGASPSAAEAYPILHGLARLLCGAEPGMLGLNLLGAGILGLLAAMTWLTVRFWAQDAMTDESSPRAARVVSAWTGHVVCGMSLFSLPGFYLAAGFSQAAWGFALLLACVALQNAYAMGGGHRRTMAIFAVVLGVAMVESPWVLGFLPLFFLRALALEWRLWDHSAKNLPLWFVGVVLGAGAMFALNGWRVTGSWALAGLWETEKAVLLFHLGYLRAFVAGPWLLNAGLAAALPILAWITARRMLDNGRTWVLLFTALVLTAASFAFYYGVNHAPWRTWLTVGSVPVATMWMAALGAGFLLMGWAVQLFAKNPNQYEELDAGVIPRKVIACRVAGGLLFPLCVIATVATVVIHARRFAGVDRPMADRFAAETVDALAKGSGSPAEGRSYLLGSTTFWIDNHLALVARRKGVPLTIFSPARMGDKAYMAALRKQFETDPVLGDADRLRLTNLLDYNFLVCVNDFFVAQPNASQIAAVYDLADVWYAARLRPWPCGTIYVPVAENATPADDPLPAQRALQGRWAETLREETLPWWDLTRVTQRAIRAHLAFMANNLGTVLDDAGRLAEAAECYLYAADLDPDNVSAKLNLYDICVRRGQLPEKRVEVNRVFEEFLRAQGRAARPRYNLSAVGRRHGYIRNYDLFVQMGWDWAVSAAPESVLAGLRNAQSALAEDDPRTGAVQAVAAAVYELQGQTDRSYESYKASLATNPKNVEALRGLARLSIQRGDVAEAGRWIAQAEAVGADDAALDVDRTAYLMAQGDLEGASKAIGRFTAENKDSVIGWAMLGMLELERAQKARAAGDAKAAEGHVERASGFILENIKRTAKENRDTYFVHVLQARLAQFEADRQDALSRDEAATPNAAARADAQAAARARWEDARANYRRAYAIRPNVRGIIELILDLDRRLGDKAAAEADALALLRDDDRHPFANFIVGTQRLEDAHVDAAVRYFRLAVEGQESPTVDILNNYADALARTADTARAKEVGLRAVTLAPQAYATWGTYALALARGGEPDKAQTAIDKSRQLIADAKRDGKIPPDFRPDPRLGFVDVWIAIAKKDLPTARARLADLRAALGETLTPLDRYDFETAEQALK